MKSINTFEHCDAEILIAGAGPAGLTAAHYAARANLRTLTVEEIAPGGQALNIDTLENYPGNVARGEVPARDGFEFCDDLYRQAKSFGAKFVMEGAAALARETPAGGAPLFALTLKSGKVLHAPALILATGAKRRVLDVPGEARLTGRGVSYCASCDGPFFRGKRILVVGGGDSACDEAQYLSRLSVQITLIHRRGKLRAQKALAERVLSNPNITVRFNTRLVEIRGEDKVDSVILEETPADGGNSSQTNTAKEDMDAVFIFAGSLPRTDLVQNLGVQFDESGYVITDQRMAASTPGLFAAGDVRASPFRQVVIAAGEGAVAAHCAAQYIDELKGESYR
jgi:thioredoxin reductase (NADPH)